MRFEQLTPRELDYKEVKFSAKISKSEYCCCDGYGDFKDDCDYCTETDSCRFSRKKDWWKENNL